MTPSTDGTQSAQSGPGAEQRDAGTREAGPLMSLARSSRLWEVGALSLGWAVAAALLGLYSQRLVLDLPLFATDEGAYLIRALLSGEMIARYAPEVPRVDNTVFLWILRGLGELTPSVLEAARVLGAMAYFAGLLAVYRTVRAEVPGSIRPYLLLLILVFPYHRFVFTALPEGWYVGLLGVMIFVTARLYRARPLVHALVLGALTALLILIKPHGLAMAASFIALAVMDFLLSPREKIATLLLRVLIYGAATFALGSLIQVVAGPPLDNPLLFVGAGYSQALSASITPQTALGGAKALFCMVCACGLLAGPPILLGLIDIHRRWRQDRETFRPGPADLVFLFTLIGLLATVAMVTIFAMKISTLAATETDRLWGRYFEFFVPILWLTAAPAMVRPGAFDGRRTRVGLAVAVSLSLVGLVACLLRGVMLFPWDATAMSAFYRPDRARWPLDNFAYPVFALAVLASLMAAGLTLTRLELQKIWLGLFAALAILSSAFDEAWVRTILPDREVMGLEIGGARLIARESPGPTAVFYNDINASRCIVLRLKASARMVMLSPGEVLDTSRFAPYQTVIVQGDHRVVGDGWTVIQPGLTLRVLARTTAGAPV